MRINFVDRDLPYSFNKIVDVFIVEKRIIQNKCSSIYLTTDNYNISSYLNFLGRQEQVLITTLHH